jgi:hypothetical protein
MAADGSPALAHARANLEGFAHFGPAYWPCAGFFTLATIDADGDSDGGGAEACRSCVIKVATDATYVMECGTFGFDQVRRFNLQDGMRTTAVEVAGPAAGYELYGSSDGPPPDTRCADCGQRLVES